MLKNQKFEDPEFECKQAIAQPVPGSAPPLPPPEEDHPEGALAPKAKLQVGCLVQVASQDARVGKLAGAWGRLNLLTETWASFMDQSSILRRVPTSWLTKLTEEPTASSSWTKNIGWVTSDQKDRIREIWLPVPLPIETPSLNTALAESEVAAGC